MVIIYIIFNFKNIIEERIKQHVLESLIKKYMKQQHNKDINYKTINNDLDIIGNSWDHC